MTIAAARSLATYAYNSLPTISEVKTFLKWRLEEAVMFIVANALLALRGHPVLFITGYFTGIVLDKAVQENFEKIKRVALFTLFVPGCLGRETLPYLVHTATFLLAAKIGSFLSLRYNTEEAGQGLGLELPKSVQNLLMVATANILWLLKGHPFLLLGGFFTGSLLEKTIEKNFEKIMRVAFGNPFIIFGHGWFIAAVWPFAFRAASFLFTAKIGSVLSLTYLPKPGGNV